MTRFEFFQQGHCHTAIQLGIVPTSVLRWYDIYNTYLEFSKESKDKEEARRVTMACNKCSKATVSRVISWFEHPVAQL